MNRTVKSCFVAGAALAALALTSSAKAQLMGIRVEEVGTLNDGLFDVVAYGNTEGMAILGTCQSVVVYDPAKVQLTNTASLSASIIALDPDDLGDATSRALLAAGQFTDATFNGAKYTGGHAGAGVTFSNPDANGNTAFARYHFKLAAGVNSATLELSSFRYPNSTGLATTKRSRYTFNGPETTVRQFNPGSVTYSQGVPAPPAALAFLAGLPMLGAALRRRTR